MYKSTCPRGMIEDLCNELCLLKPNCNPGYTHTVRKWHHFEAGSFDNRRLILCPFIILEMDSRILRTAPRSRGICSIQILGNLNNKLKQSDRSQITRGKLQKLASMLILNGKVIEREKSVRAHSQVFTTNRQTSENRGFVSIMVQTGAD